jgi:RNA-binding protein Musashi
MSLRYADDVPAKQEPVPEVKIEAAAPAEVKAEEQAEHVVDSNADVPAYSGEQDMGDQIDFNIGNGGGYGAPAGQQDAHGPGIKEDG